MVPFKISEKFLSSYLNLQNKTTTCGGTYKTYVHSLKSWQNSQVWEHCGKHIIW